MQFLDVPLYEDNSNMEYKFRSDVEPKDLWILSMRRTYRGFLGTINIVFAVSVIAMTIALFQESGIFFRILMIAACLIFPVIQPLAVYGKSIKQLENMPKDIELSFDKKGVHIACDGKKESIKWSKVKNAIKQYNMIVIMSDDKHGYIITNRELGEKRDEFYDYLCDNIRKSR